MKKTLFIATMFILSFNTFAQDEKLNNQSVIDMFNIGLSEDIIVSKINSSTCEFNTDISQLKFLKESGISDAILKAMISSDSNEEIIEDANTTLKPGIYFNDIKLLPTVFSGTKTNTLGSSFSYGIASSKIKSILNGATSNNIVEDTKPTFVFIFSGESENSAFNSGVSNWWFNTATSPNEFVLVKLNAKGKKRELVTGKVNIYAGTSIGVEEKYTIPFNIEIVNETTFKVVPYDPLEPGEYCFFYQGTIPQGGFTNQSVFDFSVR